MVSNPISCLLVLLLRVIWVWLSGSALVDAHWCATRICAAWRLCSRVCCQYMCVYVLYGGMRVHSALSCLAYTVWACLIFKYQSCAVFLTVAQPLNVQVDLRWCGHLSHMPLPTHALPCRSHFWACLAGPLGPLLPQLACSATTACV